MPVYRVMVGIGRKLLVFCLLFSTVAAGYNVRRTECIVTRYAARSERLRYMAVVIPIIPTRYGYFVSPLPTRCPQGLLALSSHTSE